MMEVLATTSLQQIGQISEVVSILLWLSFIVFIFYGQRIQMYISILEVGRALKTLKAMRDFALEEVVNSLAKFGRDRKEVETEVAKLVDQFVIFPVSLDPSGIVDKIDHIYNVRESKFLDDVRRIIPEASEEKVRDLSNLLEAASALDQLYKWVRHYYILGRRTSSFYIIVQLQMILPLVMQEARSIMFSLQAFKQGIPIGDGIGALVASRMMLGVERSLVAKDTVMAEIDYKGRKLVVVKAKGPGGNVGKPGDAIRKIIEEHGGKVACVIMVDAALKLEGEESGSVAEGVGAAIGGIGVDRFRIEEEASKYKIPLYAVIIKQSMREAISVLNSKVYKAVDDVLKRIDAIIERYTKEGDTVILAGVGNTLGIL